MVSSKTALDPIRYKVPRNSSSVHATYIRSDQEPSWENLEPWSDGATGNREIQSERHMLSQKAHGVPCLGVADYMRKHGHLSGTPSLIGTFSRCLPAVIRSLIIEIVAKCPVDVP
ncbi:hypothetical protein CIHG_08600 [Coccidioides immitis H538.4]|uniref:Uncharacterized protein n=3 Tax=Coccidioides immitis TaxID=5501 RepID=A0A0J8QNQ3_COCIT|nr:hypothetical protein CIRG_09799 [Coccidioides immitis RMSCC 2394]KMU72903.1 hypothetical protein CISG_09703 [Coccidioides immitis RMSCC 3703]KMU90795.1 hypothetical protein CIHG_08600 [Coccidioides immitis H538.4]